MNERSPFANELRFWRRERGLSQLDLAIAADSTARHVSFLETGRSRPSAVMVERLVDALEVPVRDRNGVFESAGLAGPYPPATDDPLGSEAFRLAIDALLTQHEPYPAIALDAGWNVVQTNATAEIMLAGAENLVRLMYRGAWRPLIANWPAVAWAGLSRLRRESRQLGGRSDIAELVTYAEDALRDVPRPAEVGDDLVVCPTFVIDGTVIPTVTITARFGAPRTISADEIQVELIVPADQTGRDFFSALRANATGPDA